MKTKNLFMVSLIAILAAGAARADIASTKYVDDKVSPVSAKADSNETAVTVLQNSKQEKITSSAKLDADLVSDSSSTNKFVTATEKATWNAKQNALGYTAENTANKLTDKTTSITQAHLESTSEYPSMAVAQAMIESYGETNLAGKVNKTIAGDKDSLMVRNGSGTYAKGVSSDITVATVNGTTTVTVDHATKATQDNSGNVITSTYATKTELTNLANGAVATNTADIATLKGTGAGSVSKAVADEDAAIKALIGGSYTSDSTVHSAISANTSAISTLNGDASTTGSVAKAKAEAISAAASDATSKAATAKSEAITAAATAAAGLYQTLGNKVTTVNAQSDDTHYPSAKAVYTAVSGASSSASAVDTKVGSLGDLSEGITNTSIVAAINDVASDAASDATAKVNALANGAVATNTGAIATLNGNGDGSVSKAVSDAISSEVSRANAAYATAAQGTKADSALQKADIDTGTANGKIKVADKEVSVYGLGTAAYTASSAYATAAQGTKADSAVQSVTTGTSNGTIKVDGTAVSVYGLGSAAYTASTDYAPSSMKMAVDVTPTTDGQYVLTAKVSNNAVTYSWESIGR